MSRMGEPSFGAPIYLAPRIDVRSAVHPNLYGVREDEIPKAVVTKYFFCILSFPIDLALDTLFIPFDAWAYFVDGKMKKELTPWRSGI